MNDLVKFYGQATLDALFEFACGAVWANGGDGDGWIVTSSRTEFEQLFEKWRNEHYSTAFIAKTELSNRTDYYSGQESLSFVDHRDLTPDTADFVLEIGYYPPERVARWRQSAESAERGNS